MIDKIEEIIRDKLTEDGWHIEPIRSFGSTWDEKAMEKSIRQLIKAIRRVLRYAPPV